MSKQQQQEDDIAFDFANLLPKAELVRTVEKWLTDDMPSFDIGGMVVGDQIKTAQLWMKSPGIFAGKPFVDAIFVKHLGCTVTWSEVALKEGVFVDASSEGKVLLATVVGPANELLRGERTALNTLSRCSGVASASHEAVLTARAFGWNGMIAGTRKTTPGFRIVEKYGLLVGGAATHRLDLSQMVMLKDNHIWAVGGSISKAVMLARKAAGFSQKIEVECQSLHEAIEAASAGADVIMLDNFEPEQLKIAAKAFKTRFPHVVVEASGGITMETMHLYLSEHVDVISRGNLTQGYPSIDYSLKIQK
eukprot:CAMPEP_0197838948 /NCGR_PEP_ID=MMETSP1437-20131217/40102_1 /TAXON_ID=49252 ORGANISM="Eucampia antarctica, Strain CCMP1452" /NCGR_SAMPLE_ID=MMETSP1437 /ASSEMBLY_ACC=CAM_ASM_001096 /LENGTH=305 /DNA_ID=CAMNT_0043447499 /DNA_START=38 /DNA_END=955 /DNA_ORIENTATION=-